VSRKRSRRCPVAVYFASGKLSTHIFLSKRHAILHSCSFYMIRFKYFFVGKYWNAWKLLLAKYYFWTEQFQNMYSDSMKHCYMIMFWHYNFLVLIPSCIDGVLYQIRASCLWRDPLFRYTSLWSALFDMVFLIRLGNMLHDFLGIPKWVLLIFPSKRAHTFAIHFAHVHIITYLYFCFLFEILRAESLFAIALSWDSSFRSMMTSWKKNISRTCASQKTRLSYY
jgi:hypothetical protein